MGWPLTPLRCLRPCRRVPGTACLCGCRREKVEGPGGGAAGPHLEVRAVVVVPVHDLPLPAAPGQHGDHLPPRQVCVELRGKDVDP